MHNQFPLTGEGIQSKRGHKVKVSVIEPVGVLMIDGHYEQVLVHQLYSTLQAQNNTVITC